MLHLQTKIGKFAVTMELKDILSIGGMPGLYKIIGKNTNGLIVESLDESKKRFATNVRQRISILSDIAIYSNSDDIKLWQVLKNIKAAVDAGKEMPNAKASNDEIKAAMEIALPDYDKERVYVSDMRKLFNWYHIIKDMIDYEKLGEEPEEEEGAENSDADASAKKHTQANLNKKTVAPKTASGAKSKTTTPRKMGS